MSWHQITGIPNVSLVVYHHNFRQQLDLSGADNLHQLHEDVTVVYVQRFAILSIPHRDLCPLNSCNFGDQVPAQPLINHIWVLNPTWTRLKSGEGLEGIGDHQLLALFAHEEVVQLECLPAQDLLPYIQVVYDIVGLAEVVGRVEQIVAPGHAVLVLDECHLVQGEALVFQEAHHLFESLISGQVVYQHQMVVPIVLLQDAL